MLVIIIKRMASVEECEKLRGAAENKLQNEIQKLKEACEMEAPNKRLIANMLASLDIAQHNLRNSFCGPRDEDESPAG